MSTDRTTEILNYLSAMSREIGEFRTETNRRLDSLETRVGSLETEVRTGFERVSAEFEKVHTDMRLMNHKFDEFASDMFDLRGRQRDLEKRTGALEKGAGITDSV